MRPTQQTDQNFIVWRNALYCIVYCKMYGMDMLSMSLLPSTVFLSLLALKINLRNFFTTLLEGTRLLDFSVHYPTLPYSKLKTHYSQGPACRHP